MDIGTAIVVGSTVVSAVLAGAHVAHGLIARHIGEAGATDVEDVLDELHGTLADAAHEGALKAVEAHGERIVADVSKAVTDVVAAQNAAPAAQETKPNA